MRRGRGRAIHTGPRYLSLVPELDGIKWCPIAAGEFSNLIAVPSLPPPPPHLESGQKAIFQAGGKHWKESHNSVRAGIARPSTDPYQRRRVITRLFGTRQLTAREFVCFQASWTKRSSAISSTQFGMQSMVRWGASGNFSQNKFPHRAIALRRTNSGRSSCPRSWNISHVV